MCAPQACTTGVSALTNHFKQAVILLALVAAALVGPLLLSLPDGLAVVIQLSL